MSTAPKIPVKELEGEPMDKTIESILKKDKENATHIKRIMVDHFGVKPNQINGMFKEWKREHVSLYVQIKSALEQLVKEGKVNKKKRGKPYYYWWKT